MGTIAEMFRMGGVWMYFLVMIASLGFATSVLCVIVGFAAKKAPALYVVGTLSLLVGLAGPVVGFVGYSVGMSRAQDVIEKATPENRARILEHATEAASYPLKFAAVIAPVPLLVGAVTIFVGTRRRA